MDPESDEARWRNGLEARGVEWVKAKLQERPGRPEDSVHDVVFSGRLPTRAFCTAWYAEQDNRIFTLSPTGKVTLVVAIVLVLFIMKGFAAWTSPVPPSEGGAVGGGGSMATAGGTDIATQLSAPASITDTTPIQIQQPSTLCSFINYQTARCPAN